MHCVLSMPQKVDACRGPLEKLTHRKLHERFIVKKWDTQSIQPIHAQRRAGVRRGFAGRRQAERKHTTEVPSQLLALDLT
jgi:hypothetical protein